MKKIQISVALVLLVLSSGSVSADLTTFARNYFDAWVKTQEPNSTEENLEVYLQFLTSDVGHQHLPYDVDATRSERNREAMHEGMVFYLGSHTKYHANLEEVMVGFNVIVIKYSTKSEGVHPQTKELVEHEYDTIEVLEMDGEKVGVIRKYSE